MGSDQLDALYARIRERYHALLALPDQSYRTPAYLALIAAIRADAAAYTVLAPESWVYLDHWVNRQNHHDERVS